MSNFPQHIEENKHCFIYCGPEHCNCRAGNPKMKPRVSKLKRIGPPQNGGWFYYSPDGHIVGPFDYEEEMEKDIKENYEEV